MSDFLRIYSPDECGIDGYPIAWHKGEPAVKDLVREEAEERLDELLALELAA